MKNRRRLLVALGASGVVGMKFASAQQPAKIWRVGYAPFALPMSYLPGANPENYRSLDASTAQGAMIDVHRAIANDAGYQIQFVALVAGELTEAIGSRKVDIRAVASPNMNVDFMNVTEAIFNDSEVLIAHKSESKSYTTLDDLKGIVVGSRTGTASESDLKSNGFETKSFAAVPDLLNAVDRGEIKVAVNTTYVNTVQILSLGQYPNVKIVNSYVPRLANANGIGVRKDEVELLASINKSLKKLKTNGTIKGIFAKYGLADVLVK